MRLLLVDDDELNHRILVRELKDQYEIVSVTDPYAALRLLRTERFDGVVSDLDLGSPLDGVRLLAELRDRFPQVKRILVSSHDNVEERGQTVAQGILARPWPFGSLRDVLARLLYSATPANAGE